MIKRRYFYSGIAVDDKLNTIKYFSGVITRKSFFPDPGAVFREIIAESTSRSGYDLTFDSFKIEQLHRI